MWKILLALLQHKYNGVLCISYKDKDNQLRFYSVQDGNVLATLKQIDKDLHAQFRCYFPHV